MDLSSLVALEQGFENVFFNEKEHSYTIKGEPAKMSVTQLLKKYEKPFDFEKLSNIVAKKQGMMVEDVRGLWDFKREYACDKGTMLHRFIENVLLRKKTTLDKDHIFRFVNKFPDYLSTDLYYTDITNYIKNFYDFYKWWKTEHILIRSELVIGDSETKICGCVDNLSFNFKTKNLVILDYKSNKGIQAENKEKLLKDLSHLDNCELVKYSLQLNLYKKIIERNTSLKIEKLYIVWLGGDQFELIDTLNLENEAEILLQNIC